MSRLVVSLTTIPSRLGELRATLESLTVGQRRKPDRVYLTLPLTGLPSRGSPLLKYELPEWLQAPILKFLGLVEIVYIPTDLGPMSKLWGGLVRELEPDARIVVCDDDVVYGATWLAELDAHSQRHPGCAVGFGAFDFVRGPPFFRMRIGGIKNVPHIPYPSTFATTDAAQSVQCLMGVSGALFPRSAFTSTGMKTLVEWSRHPRMCRADDVTISAWLSLAGVRRYLVKTSPELDEAGVDRGLVDALSTSWMHAVYNHAFAYSTLRASHGAFDDDPSCAKDVPLFICWIATVLALVLAALLIVYLCAYLFANRQRQVVPLLPSSVFVSDPVLGKIIE